MTGKLGKTKKKTIKIVSIVLAAALLVGGIGGYCLFSVKAQGILTGLESKVSQKVAGNEAFRILEVVPDGSRGEIGNLVKGQEADFLQDRMDAYLFQNPGLTNSKAVRENYINNELRGKLAAYCGDNQPFSGNANYYETYFLKAGENTADYQVMTFSREHYETVTLKGSYELVSGQDGNYMPNFSKVQASDTGSYKVTFSTEERTDTTEELYHQTYVIKIEGGQTVYEAKTPSGGETAYYIRECTYVGTGSAEGKYDPVLDTLKPYCYVAEGGVYQFVPDDNQSEQTVEIGKVFYQGGMTNNDWFRTKILASANSSRLQFEVTTKTESELASYDLSNVDMLYLCSDTTGGGLNYTNPQNVWNRVKSLVDAKVPCVLDAQTGIQQYCGDYAIGYSNQNDFVQGSLYIMQTKANEWEGRKPIYHNLLTKLGNTDGVGEVSSFIKSENTMRSGEDRLSEDITRLFLLQYIIDYSQQRNVGTKESFHVLEIQPTKSAMADTQGFQLTKEKVAEWAGIPEDQQDIITITTMSAAEFVGKTEDLNKNYDLIYIGACIDDFNTTGSGSSKSTVYNDTRMNGLIYSHTGDYVVGKRDIIGILDVDYAAAYEHQDYTPKPYAKLKNSYIYNNGGSVLTGYYNYGEYRTDYTGGVLTQRLENVSLWMYYNLGERIGSGKSVVADLMVYRYSGNDITKTKTSDLMEYVQANYPVVVSDALYQTDSNGNKTVNTAAVDNTSYLYEFLEQVKGNENIFSVQQADRTGSAIRTYLNLPKPEIQYFDVDNPTDSVKYEGISTEAGNSFEDVSKMKIDTRGGSQTGVYTARVGFTLNSLVDSSESTTYTPDFYIDLNADGKFLESGNGGSSEKLDCLIYNYKTGEEAPKDSTGNYQLSSQVRYVLEREIPSSYLGVLTWKLEMKQSANPYVRTSDIQYTKVEVDGIGKTETVRVLQINSQNSSDNNTTINLQDETRIKEYLRDVESKTGLKFEITTIGGYNFSQQYATSAENFYKKYLEDYDMLIIGFADKYYDLENTYNGIDAIKLFINSGKSVLFSHDTTSYINVPESKTYEDIHLAGFSDDLTTIHEWGYDMNQTFRDILGMDRYGVASSTNDALSAQQNLLRQGQHLTVDKDHAEAEGNRAAAVNKCKNTKDSNKMVYFTTRGMTEGSLSSNRDIAYAANTYDASTGTAQAYGQTQGYTNGILNKQLVTDTKYLDAFGNKQQKTNLKSSLSVTGSNASGIAKTEVTSVNEGLITHFPYEIGSQFTSATTHYQYYQLNLDQDDDGDGEGDMVVWYCMSGSSDANANKVYGSLPNDARNNYYIYNIGNVTYTGMGHTSLDHSGNDLETKLFINTMVAAYKAGVEPPTIKILESAEKTSGEKKYEYITYDNAANGALTGDVSFYFTITDPNLTSAQKNLTVDFSYNQGSADVAIDPAQVEVRDVTTNTPVSGSYTEGHVYYATIRGMESLIQQEDLQIKATVHCSFNYYGKVEEHTATAGLTVVKSELFNLN